MNIIGELGCILGQALGSCVYRKPMSEYPVYKKSWQEIRQSLEDLGLLWMENALPDTEFFYTDEFYWQEMFKNLIYPADHFAELERKDCDDYSKKASADSSFYYGLNCLQVWGDTPGGYHAFNMIKGDDEWRIFEPNSGWECAGELLLIDNKYGWIPRQWKV